jgi:hypothetical protein
MGEWTLDLGDVEIATPDPIDEANLEAADTLMNLPEHQ